MQTELIAAVNSVAVEAVKEANRVLNEWLSTNAHVTVVSVSHDCVKYETTGQPGTNEGYLATVIVVYK